MAKCLSNEVEECEKEEKIIEESKDEKSDKNREEDEEIGAMMFSRLT